MLRVVNRQAFFFSLGILSVLCLENTPAYASPPAYPAPFGGTEIHSTHIAHFFKWIDLLARMDARTKPLKPWLDNEKMLKELPSGGMIGKVNDTVNKYGYTADLLLWGISDYWATPAEFFAKGGDCEDFSIAKYAWLRSLGIPEERLRIALVHDRIRNMPHAVLILYINEKAMVLDSQVREIRDSDTISRYRILYSINRAGWWLPRASKTTKVTMMGAMEGQIEPASGSDVMPFPEDCIAGYLLPECINAIAPSAGP